MFFAGCKACGKGTVIETLSDTSNTAIVSGYGHLVRHFGATFNFYTFV